MTAALAVALTVIACSTDDFFRVGQLGIDDGAGDGAKENLKVDGSREERLELSTGAALTVPKGAVDHDVTIGVERPSDTKAFELVETLKSVKAVASAPYVLTPHGTEFAKDVKLEIPIINNKDKQLVAAYLKDESDRAWKYLDSPTVEGDVATVTLKHFSVVVLVDRARAGFEIDEPDVREDAGSADDQDDAGQPQDGGDAATANNPDAGGAAVDAGVVTMDGGATVTDAAPQGALDATPPASGADAGVIVTSDSGAGTATDSGAGTATDSGVGTVTDSGSMQLDTGADLDTGMTGTGVDDASSDASRDAQPPTCEPMLCEPQQCGYVDNGCGEEMPCGECEEFGGVCGLFYPNVCDFPVD